MMDFIPQIKIKDIPDPYYGAPSDFDHVLDLIERAAHGLLQEICNKFEA